MRRCPRWLLVGAALIAMAASGAHAKVRPIDLDACSASCSSPATEAQAEAGDDAGPSITLSLFGGGANGADDPDLTFDPKAMPTVLVSGLPSALASADLQSHGARGPSPYDFFEDVISLPQGVRTKFAAASFFLFAPSLIGRLTLTDILSNSHALFARPGPAM